MRKLVVGDCVRLKSGSPRMTIQKAGKVWLDVVWIKYETSEPRYAKLHRDCVFPDRPWGPR